MNEAEVSLTLEFVADGEFKPLWSPWLTLSTRASVLRKAGMERLALRIERALDVATSGPFLK